MEQQLVYRGRQVAKRLDGLRRLVAVHHGFPGINVHVARVGPRMGKGKGLKMKKTKKDE